MYWVQSVTSARSGEIIAIDGKTVRRSFDRAGRKQAIQMVSAWAKTNGVVLGQVKTDEKSNEIIACRVSRYLGVASHSEWDCWSLTNAGRQARRCRLMCE